jgi:hypothetical protein
MKIVLVMAAALGFSVSVAAADCAGHAKVTTTAVDQETTVASIVKQTPAAPAEQSAPAEQATQE